MTLADMRRAGRLWRKGYSFEKLSVLLGTTTAQAVAAVMEAEQLDRCPRCGALKARADVRCEDCELELSLLAEYGRLPALYGMEVA